MTDYTNLVEALRFCAQWHRADDALANADQAADAIEELQQIADHHEQTAKDYWKEACEYKAQLPKRGEWKTTDAFPHRVYCSNCFRTYVPNDRWQIWVDKPGEGGLERNYCPSCGAKMEVQE